MAGKTIGLTIGRKDFVAETNAWSEAQIAAAERLPSLLEERGILWVMLKFGPSVRTNYERGRT